MGIGKPLIETTLDSYFPDNRNIVVLDVGSASGRVVQLLVDNGVPEKNISGVEISPNEVEIARSNFPDATFTVGDIAKVRLCPKKYDLVTCNMVVEFLDDNALRDASRNIYLSMKPGGIYLINTTHPDRYRGKYGVTKEGRVKTGRPWGGEFYNYYRKIDTYKRKLEKVGFQIAVIRELEMPEKAKELATKQPDRYAPFTSFGAPARLAIIARKPE